MTVQPASICRTLLYLHVCVVWSTGSTVDWGCVKGSTISNKKTLLPRPLHWDNYCRLTRARCWQEWQGSVREAAAGSAEDGSGRVSGVAGNLREWSQLVSQTLQGVAQHAVCRCAVLVPSI